MDKFKINLSKFLKKILMLHLLKLVNFEINRKRNKVDFLSKLVNLRRACIVTILAINNVKKNSGKFLGKSEKYMARSIKRYCRKRGYRQGFPLLVASGENTQKIHARPTNRIIQKNDIIMIDIGVKRAAHYFSDYCSDMTRTFFLGGARPTDFQKDVYNIVKEAHDLALERIRIGIRGHVLHEMIRKFIESKGFNLPHGLGHSTRRYTHATPFLSSLDTLSILEQKEHVTIEPGIYVSKNHPKLPKGHPPFGVRIEDLIIIMEEGYIALTSNERIQLP